MIAIAIHGGASVVRGIPAKTAARARAGLEDALEAGYRILKQGGNSLDAVSAAVVLLEDCPVFNAGRGASYNADGRHELDAAIMDGASLRAGAVAAVRHVRNPILAARAVMEHTDHVLLCGDGAERVARGRGLAMVRPKYFHTPRQLAALRKRLKRPHGTVGAVALDAHGNLAAATSTGGYTGKLPGRIGDSPIIGAGNYADNRCCAVSGTGQGESFIRAVAAYDVAARMRYRGESLQRACAAALSAVARLGGTGGMIAVDRRRNVVMPFNSQGMYRACIGRDGRRLIAIY